MKQSVKEYNVTQDFTILYCDNMSVVHISKNIVQHSRIKHIDIQHHFMKDLVEEKIISLDHISTDKQLADIFPKALYVIQFENFRSTLGLCVIDL